MSETLKRLDAEELAGHLGYLRIIEQADNDGQESCEAVSAHIKAVESVAIGKLYSPKALFLRQHVGEGGIDEHQYEMSIEQGSQAPMILSKTTGSWFVLSWKDIVKLAIAKGVDEPRSD